MKLLEFFIPEPDALRRKEISYDQARYFIIFTQFITLLTIFYVVIYSLIVPILFISLNCFICTCVMVGLLFYFKKTANFRVSSHVILLDITLLIFILSLVTGGMESVGNPWFAMVPLLAGMLLGVQGAIVWGFGAVFFCFGVAGFELIFGRLPSISPKDFQVYNNFSSFLGVIGSTSFFTYHYQKLNSKNLKQLTMTSKELDQTIRVLSHDISNPLSVITLISSNLRRDETLDYAKSEKISHAATIISHIINNVRDLQAITSGKSAFQLTDVNLYSTIGESLFVLEQKLKRKHIRVSLNEFPIDLCVVAHKVCLSSQIFTNLLSNAIKFSNYDSEIAINVTELEKSVQVTITDKGIGIPKSILKQIFDPFAVTSRKGTEGEEGTGFGMPIVKSYVEKFGGQLAITSCSIDEDPDNHGTQVVILLKKFY